ncbi:ribosome recycling factor [Candidatus Hodgkinia cicadicola]|uniref:Ribosome recycling factor n=1 Tax=Candidatus Hodgkinia cicadicola TaxID=573658 RepID=A0ABX4MFU1_9HYPH|nr:ribosome recycling factor [Candidatus Hodgkinia cicadicola]PIM95555.1 ribosome recycling factor [Candidatus Hodgkinia cicadicola]
MFKLKPNYSKLTSENIYIQLNQLLLNLIKKFDLISNKILPSRLDMSLVNEIRTTKNQSLKSFYECIYLSDTIIELRPICKLRTNDIIPSLISNNLNINIELNGNHIRLSLPSITTQRRKIALNELSKMFERYKTSIRTVRKEFINKIKLVKGICEDNRLGFLKRIDNDITKATILLSDSYLRNKNRLLS